jgi:hypothetical protein
MCRVGLTLIALYAPIKAFAVGLQFWTLWLLIWSKRFSIGSWLRCFSTFQMFIMLLMVKDQFFISCKKGSASFVQKFKWALVSEMPHLSDFPLRGCLLLPFTESKRRSKKYNISAVWLPLCITVCLSKIRKNKHE